MADNKKEFEILSGKQQILVRPQMWVGSMDPLTQPMFLISDDHVERRDVTFIPAFRKIIDEILDNSIDALVKAKQSDKSIKVKMTDDTVVIEDNGPGIPVIKKDISQIKDNSISESEKKKLANTYLPEIAWTRLFSGTNFQNSDSKTTIGNHGIGSKATAIFSTKFVGKTDDGKHSCKVTSKNNLESTSCNVSESSGISGTKVEFIPDLVRFKLDKIEQVYHDLMYQRLICLSISFPDISFSFNGKRINLNEKKFLKLFSDNFTFTNFDRGFIGVYANSTDEFNFFTYVNGLALNRGGAHVDFIATQLVNPIRDKLVKKYKDIKPADIRNRLSLVVFMKDFPNPKFDSQTKETLTNSNGEVSQYFKDSIDFEKLSKEILKNDTIIDPIIETFKLKEEVKNRVALKQASKSKVKIDVDKYLTATGGKNKYLMVTEGLCLDDEQEIFILNENKNIPIKDVKIGDLVLTHNQNIKPVVDVTHKITECVKIKTKSGKEIICSKQHRFFVYDSNANTWRFKRVVDIDPSIDRLVNNKLAAGFILRDFTISELKDCPDKKYKIFINLSETEKIYSTESHKFTIFNVETNEFDLLPAKHLRPETMKIVMVFSPS